MSIETEVKAAMGTLPVQKVWVDRNLIRHGVKAVEVNVVLNDGRVVIGTFDREQKHAGKSVKSSGHYNIPALMRAKVESVLAGTAER